MKRSEALEKIADTIYHSCETTWIEARKSADAVLTKLEEIGMLPPRTLLKPLNLEDNAWDQES